MCEEKSLHTFVYHFLLGSICVGAVGESSVYETEYILRWTAPTCVGEGEIKTPIPKVNPSIKVVIQVHSKLCHLVAFNRIASATCT